MTRIQLASELLRDCLDGSLGDHQAIAAALIRGDTPAEILDMPECDQWPETYIWLKNNLK